MTAKLYGMAHSHPAVAVRLMLEHKRIEHEVWNILPGLHPLAVRAAGFPGRTVPALRLGDERIQGTLEISRALDERYPERPLFPVDPDARRAVEEAERFGHDELQALARRVFRWAALRSNAVRAWMARDVVGMPAPVLAGWAYKPVIVYFARIVGADDATVRDDLRRLPALLDRVDGLLADGVIGGAQRNAADYQLLASVRLLLVHEDLRPIVTRWRCAQEALELIPAYPEPVPAALPTEWLPVAEPRGSGRPVAIA
jgi:glutathione S-transferase